MDYIFSFGDYFKEQAIHYAWNLITKDFGIDKNKLYVTVYHEDDEAFKFWKKIAGFSDDRIIRGIGFYVGNYFMANVLFF